MGILNYSPQLLRKFEQITLKPVHVLTEEQKDDFMAQIQEIDVLVHMLIGRTWGVFSMQSVMSQLKPSCTRITIPKSFLRGYHPETVYLRDENGKMNDSGFCPYNDINLIKAYIEGTSVERVVERIEDPDFYSTSFLENNFEETISELKSREASTDIGITDFIEKHWRTKRLFFSINHCSNIVLLEVANRILDALGLRRIPVERISERSEYLGENQPPVYSSLRKIISPDLIYQQPRVRGEVYSLVKYVEHFFRYYDEIPDVVNFTFKASSEVKTP